MWRTKPRTCARSRPSEPTASRTCCGCRAAIRPSRYAINLIQFRQTVRRRGAHGVAARVDAFDVNVNTIAEAVDIVIDNGCAYLSAAHRRNLELLLERLPVPLLCELAFGATRLPASFDLAAFLASAGNS